MCGFVGGFGIDMNKVKKYDLLIDFIKDKWLITNKYVGGLSNYHLHSWFLQSLACKHRWRMHFQSQNMHLHLSRARMHMPGPLKERRKRYINCYYYLINFISKLNFYCSCSSHVPGHVPVGSLITFKISHMMWSSAKLVAAPSSKFFFGGRGKKKILWGGGKCNKCTQSALPWHFCYFYAEIVKFSLF